MPLNDPVKRFFLRMEPRFIRQSLDAHLMLSGFGIVSFNISKCWTALFLSLCQCVSTWKHLSQTDPQTTLALKRESNISALYIFLLCQKKNTSTSGERSLLFIWWILNLELITRCCKCLASTAEISILVLCPGNSRRFNHRGRHSPSSFFNHRFKKVAAPKLEVYTDTCKHPKMCDLKLSYTLKRDLIGVPV